MGLQASGLIEVSIECATISLAIEFDVVRGIKFCVILPLNKNGLLGAAEEQIYSARINRPDWYTGCLQVRVGDFVDTVFRYRYFVIRLSEVDPFVGILAKGVLSHPKCQAKDPYPNLAPQSHFHPIQSCQQGKYGFRH